MRYFLHLWSKDLFRIEFVAYEDVVSGGIVKFIYAVISKEPVRILVITFTRVVGRGVRDVVVTRRAMVGIVFVVGSAIGGVVW